MYMTPCRSCPHSHKSCAIKDAKRVAVRGAGLTSMNFRCEKRLSTLPPGQRVVMTLQNEVTLGGYNDYEYQDWEDVDIVGTVMREARRGRVLVWLDEMTTRERNPVALWPHLMKPIEGHRVAVCSECGQPEGTKPIKAWSCWKCEGLEEIGIDEFGRPIYGTKEVEVPT